MSCAAEAAMGFRKILVPMDFSPCSRLAVDHAIALARKFRGRIVEAAAAEAILNEAESADARLIGLAVGNKGLLERTFLGATAERVIRDAHVPVLSIPV
jgi:nucleotide-binding universal stress UspA family protein